MRHRVKLKPSIFADKMCSAYADGWGVFCDTCQELVTTQTFESIARANAIAREHNTSSDPDRHSYTVYPVVGNTLITDAAQFMIVWTPVVYGAAVKAALTVDEYATMFERVEE